MPNPTSSPRSRGFRAPFAAWLVVGASMMPFGAQSAPELKVVEHAHEGAIVSVRMDHSGNGRAIVHDCARCTHTLTYRVTPKTRFFAGAGGVFEEDRRDLDRVAALVFYDPKTNVLTRIIIE